MKKLFLSLAVVLLAGCGPQQKPITSELLDQANNVCEANGKLASVFQSTGMICSNQKCGVDIIVDCKNGARFKLWLTTN